MRTLTAQGVLTGTGCGNGRICPREALQRWEAAVWIVRILDGDDPSRTVSSRFADVDTDNWWAAHVERLAELEVTLGCALSPARFCPHRPVTRAQMASFLQRAFKLPESQQPAGFQDTRDTTHETAIDALHAAGITKGCRTQPAALLPPTPHHTRPNGLLPDPHPPAELTPKGQQKECSYSMRLSTLWRVFFMMQLCYGGGVGGHALQDAHSEF